MKNKLFKATLAAVLCATLAAPVLTTPVYACESGKEILWEKAITAVAPTVKDIVVVSPIVQEIPVAEDIVVVSPIVQEIPVAEDVVASPIVQEIPVAEDVVASPIVQEIPVVEDIVASEPNEKEPLKMFFKVPGLGVEIPWYEELLHNAVDDIHGSEDGKETVWEWEGEPQVNVNINCKNKKPCYQVDLSEDFSFRTENVDWILECGFKISKETVRKDGTIVYSFKYVR